MECEGKVAVVTGAASGIGLALAHCFAGQRMRLVLADIEQPRLDEVAQNFQQQGATVLAQACDVAVASDVAALAEQAYSHFGAVHVLCNNAGVAGASLPIWLQTPDTWRWVLGVNLMGVIHGISSFVPRMISGGEPGHVVNTASLAGLVTGPLLAPYYASKHAVVTLSESLFFDLQIVQANIGVSVLCPGFVKTRIGQSERNRPQAGDFGAPGSDQMKAKMKELIDQGAAPDDIARQVLEAIRSGQFWILTHPEMDTRIRDRTDRMLARLNPEVPEIAARKISE